VLASGAGWTALDYAGVAGVKRQGGAMAFSPLSVPNCVYWFDGADTNAVTLTTNSLATAWRSKGSNTNAATQTAYSSAYSNDAVSGRSALWFNGTTMRGYSLPTAVSTPATGAVAYTFIACYNRAANNIVSMPWGGPSEGTYGQPGMHWIDNKIYFQIQGKYRASSNTYATGRAVLVYYSDGSANAADYNMRRNGTAVTDLGNAANVTSESVGSMGFYSTTSSRYHSGFMFENIYYNRKLTISEIQQIEEYLRAKWSAY
jgi:hypothetical protein